MEIDYNRDEIDFLSDILFTGLKGKPVVYSAVSFRANYDEKEYVYKNDRIFNVSLDGPEGFADYTMEIHDEELNQYIRTIVAMNFCFDLRVYIKFCGESEMDFYIPRVEYADRTSCADS